MSAPATVASVLGDVRPVWDSYPNGEYTCPWCGAGVFVDDEKPCPNPACEANPHANAERILARRQEAAEREQRIAEMRERSQRAAETSRRWRDQQDAEIREAADAGYCVRCFVRSGHRKTVRHRTVNYHEEG